MRVRTIFFLSVAAVIAAVGILFLYSYISDQQAIRENAEGLVEEGFLVLEGNPDEAIRLAKEARGVDESNLYSLILQGRALFLKKRHHDSIEVLQEAMNSLQDLDLMPELNYHIGYNYFTLCEETGIRDDWDEAFRHLSDATRLGVHRADANIALGMLHLIKGYRNEDKVISYWDKAFALQKDGGERYEDSDDSGNCPHCRQGFKSYRDNAGVMEVYELVKTYQEK